MIDFETAYPGRVEPASTDYPVGTFKDKSGSTSNDGTPIADAERLKDWHGAFMAILEEAGITPSGAADTAQDSDVADAIFKSQIISNDALANDLSLSKFDQGAINFTYGVTGSTITLNTVQASFGNYSGGIFAAYSRAGIRFAGASEPGDEDVFFRASTYDLTEAIAGSSAVNVYNAPASTTYGGHQHIIGQKYTFASYFNTNIPSTENILGSVSCGAAYTDGTSRISPELKIHFVDSGGFWQIDFVEQINSWTTLNTRLISPATVTIFYDGDYLG